MIELNSQSRTQSTLLIPDRLLNDFKEKTDSNSRELYFHLLLKRYSPLILTGAFGSRRSIKIRFQNQGENLVRKNFKPLNEDWAQCQLLADYLGFSMTAVFTMLLTLDISDFPMILRERFFDGGVPPTITNIFSLTHLNYVYPSTIARKIRFRIKP